MKHFSRFLLASLLASVTSFTVAQEYPNKPVIVVVPFPAGGAVDIVTRSVLEQVSKNFPHPIIVDNKPGAEGLVGALAVKRAPADGYTLMSAGSFIVTTPLLKTAPGFQTSEFVPVGMIGQGANVIVTSPTLPANTLAEFIAYARARPGQLNAATGSRGGSVQLGTDLFMHTTGARMQMVPFRGANDMVPTLVSGQLSFAIMPSSIALPVIKTGMIRPLAVVSTSRLPILPDVPTVIEAGLPASSLIAPWYGIMARAGTPSHVIDRWNTEINTALKSPNVLARMRELGAIVTGGSAVDYARALEAEKQHWAKLFNELGKQKE